MSYAQTIARHDRAVLQFSGGKDSLACLYLLRPYWNKITVMWVDTGDAYPETVQQMKEIQALVPRFLRVCAFPSQPRQVAKDGFPSDLVPIWSTPTGRAVSGSELARVQSPMDCCRANLWAPAGKAVIELGATLVIRGQRTTDPHRNPIRSGHIEDGIEYLFPLEDWQEESVLAYLRDNGVPLPRHYAYFNSSLDCMTCTAYLDTGRGRMRYLSEFHPVQFHDVKQRSQYLLRAARQAAAPLRDIAE